MPINVSKEQFQFSPILAGQMKDTLYVWLPASEKIIGIKKDLQIHVAIPAILPSQLTRTRPGSLLLYSGMGHEKDKERQRHIVSRLGTEILKLEPRALLFQDDSPILLINLWRADLQALGGVRKEYMIISPEGYILKRGVGMHALGFLGDKLLVDTSKWQESDPQYARVIY